jgi:serine protease Do
MTARPAPSLRKLWTTLALVGLLLCLNVPLRADLPAVLEKPAPDNIDDLKAIQKQLQKVLEKVVPCTVGVQVGGASGSGVIVSADGYVLTAGHVSGKPDQECTLILSDGKRVKGKTLGQNKGIDSGMIKITEDGTWPYCEMGESGKLNKGSWCVSVGHPGGYIKGRSPVVRLGRVLELDKSVIRSDCTLVGGDSGGPLFDMDGKVIGIHSRIGGRISDNFHVPVDTYRDTWDRLAKSESWGGGFDLFSDGPAPFVGMRFDLDAKECKVTQVREGSPAEKAGVKVGDVVLKFGSDKPTGPEELLSWIRKKKPGDEVAIEVQRDKEVMTLKLVVGKRPN